MENALEEQLDHLANLAGQGHATHARTLADRSRERAPLAWHLGHAAIAAVLQDLPALTTHAEAAERLAPDDPLVLQALAMRAMLAGDGDEAERQARRALHRDESPRAQRGLANIQLRLGRLEDAERTLRELVSRAPSDGYAMKQLGKVRRLRGDEAGALAWFARAFAADPTDTEPVDLTIGMYREAGWPIGALVLSRVTREGVHPPEVGVLLDLVALVLMGRLSPDLPGREAFDATVPAVRGLVADSVDMPVMAQLRVARALVDSGKTTEALAILGRTASPAAADASATLAEWRFVLGLAEEQRGDKDAALAAWEGAVEADPQAWEAACNASALAMELGHLERAAAVLARVPTPLKRLRPQLLFNEAVYCKNTGRHREAWTRAAWLREHAGGLMDALLDELEADLPTDIQP
jgi:tetratricopeptide (TPR) repeat protein